MDNKYIIKGLTREGRLIDIPVREQYDYEDGFPFSNQKYDDMDAVHDAIRTYRDDIRHNYNITKVVVLTVVDI